MTVTVFTWYFFSRNWELLCHLTYAFYVITNQTIISFVGCSQSIWNFTVPAHNEFPSLSKGFLNVPLLRDLWRTARTWNVTTTLCCCSNVQDGFEVHIIVGQQSFCLINKCTNNVQLHQIARVITTVLDTVN